MRDIVDNRSIEYKKLESMIPVLTEDGFGCNLMAETRAIRNGILFNKLYDESELRSLMSLTNRVIELGSQDLEQLIYDKMEYLGFTSKKIPLKIDMSFKEKTICFCGNFMLFHDEGNKDDFLKILNKLRK